jgi:hypothetical protein
VPLELLDGEPVEPGDDGLGEELLGDELLDDELLSVDDDPEVDGGVVVDGGVAVGGGGVDGGEADGVRSPGRSPTRSVRLSLQAVSRPALSATASTAVRNFFISMPPPVGLRDR